MDYHRGVDGMDDWHGWLAQMTGMDDWHGWLAWMTGMDDWLGWLAWMTGVDDYPKLILYWSVTDWQTNGHWYLLSHYRNWKTFAQTSKMSKCQIICSSTVFHCELQSNDNIWKLLSCARINLLGIYSFHQIHFFLLKILWLWSKHQQCYCHITFRYNLPIHTLTLSTSKLSMNLRDFYHKSLERNSAYITWLLTSTI